MAFAATGHAGTGPTLSETTLFYTAPNWNTVQRVTFCSGLRCRLRLRSLTRELRREIRRVRIGIMGLWVMADGIFLLGDDITPRG